MASKDPEVAITLTTRSEKLKAKLREASGWFKTFSKDVGKSLSGSFLGKDVAEGKKGGMLGKAGAVALGSKLADWGSSGASWLADQAKQAYDFNDQLTRLMITAGKSPADMGALARTVREASDATGIGKADILAADKAYVALTGDLDGATKATKVWAQVAQASNSDIKDIASTAQALRDNLKIKPEDEQAAFAALITQGKEGAIELKDLAAQLASISPLMSEFKGGTGLGGLRDLGATVQVVRKGFGSAEETVTGVQSLMTALFKNAPRFQAAGVKMFDTDGKGVKHMRGFLQVVDAISHSKLVSDPTKMEKAFGRVEAYRAYLQIRNNRELLESLVDKSKDASVIQRDLGTYTRSTAGSVTLAWNKAKNEIADAFTPERIASFAETIKGLIPVVVTIVAGIGKIAAGFDKIIGAGQAIRSFLGVDNESVGISDLLAASRGDKDAKDRVDSARSFNKSRDWILASEDNGQITPETMKRAYAAKYNPGKGGAADGQQRAGGLFFENTGIPDVVETTQKANIALREEARATATRAHVQQFVKEHPKTAAEFAKLGLAINRLTDAIIGTPVEVKVGADAVVKATKNAPAHGRRPAK